jgi:hypothetical protein
MQASHSPFADAFVDGARFRGASGDVIEMRVVALGDLRVPTGRLCVADPLTTNYGQPNVPLAREVPTGSFPVEIAVAMLANGDQRVACARVRLRALHAVHWEPAGFEGGRAPGGDDIAAYGVDAGMGSFFDAAARARVDEVTTEAWLAAMNARSRDTWTWHVAEVGEANVVMFSSGWGDGLYSTFYGFDAGGLLVEIVTDFEVLLGPVSESFDVPVPTPRGAIHHPLLDAHGVTARTPLFSRRTIILGGTGTARVELSDGSPVELRRQNGERHYSWKSIADGACARVAIMTGVRPLEPW